MLTLLTINFVDTYRQPLQKQSVYTYKIISKENTIVTED
jgi:hypothetical protein